MKIGLAQLDIQLQEKDNNFSTMKRLVEEREEVELMLFPEMSLTGFSMDVEASLKQADLFHEKIKKLAVKEGVMIGYGVVKQDPQTKKTQNHYIILDETGKEILDYTKIHPFSFVHEEAYYQAGEQIVLAKVKDFMCSTFICYDLRFPEIFQAASKKADFIIISANWPKERLNHWRSLLIARAIENQVYIAGVNCVGLQGNSQYPGHSLLVSPSGQVLREGSEKEEVIYYTFSNDVERIRKNFPVRSDRKEKLYQKLMNNSSH